jgi:HEAT repeat protein
MISVQSLVLQLTCGNDQQAEAAVKELSNPGPQAMPALQELLGPGDRRWWAIRALARLSDTRSIPALFEVLSEDSSLMEALG